MGRTARGGREGQALLMLREEELPFVRYLRERKVMLNPIEVQQGKILNIQKQVSEWRAAVWRLPGTFGRLRMFPHGVVAVLGKILYLETVISFTENQIQY